MGPGSGSCCSDFRAQLFLSGHSFMRWASSEVQAVPGNACGGFVYLHNPNFHTFSIWCRVEKVRFFSFDFATQSILLYTSMPSLTDDPEVSHFGKKQTGVLHHLPTGVLKVAFFGSMTVSWPLNLCVIIVTRLANIYLSAKL